MSTISSVLAATDFSDDSRSATRRAALLAAEQQVPFTLLHVMSGPSLESLRAMFRVPEDAEAKLVADAARTLDDQAVELAKLVKQPPTTQVRVGNVVNEVLAATPPAGLLVLGARGWNPLRDMILGTTADRLLRQCRKPVLVTKRAPQETYRRVLVPVDFSPYSAPALAMALRLAPRADITLVHAFELPFEGKLWLAGVEQKRIQEYRIAAKQQALNDIGVLLKEVGPDAQRCFREVEHGEPAPLILAHEKRVDADLIVIGKRGRSIVEETLLGSVTRHILSDAKCDVLVVQEPLHAVGS